MTYYRTDSNFYGNREVWDLAVYAEDEMKFSPLWIFTLGVRFDYHQVVGAASDRQISPRTGFCVRKKRMIKIPASQIARGMIHLPFANSSNMAPSASQR